MNARQQKCCEKKTQNYDQCFDRDRMINYYGMHATLSGLYKV